MIELSILHAGLSKTGNIVTDSATGLEWQDDAVGTKTIWQDAIARCETLTLDAKSDWRLPNLNELTSIVDDTKSYPAIDTTVFNNTISNYYWSSTTIAGSTNYAWRVYFNYGPQYGNYKTDNSYVRCVRAGQ